VGVQRHAPAGLPPGKTRLCGPQGRSGRVRKISPPPGFDPRTVQAVASRYTDCAILALRNAYRSNNIKFEDVAADIRTVYSKKKETFMNVVHTSCVLLALLISMVLV
jgi:hypothetical protein